jgi:3'-phosphoadenosine 5'-phosphosulfate sulfotransferase (PAPS reductase)/FAD synthetase
MEEQDRIRAVDCTLGGSECGQDVLMKQESNLLANTLRIAPVEHWTSVDEIWILLRNVAPYFGWPTADLEKAYPGDDSRLGCWMCTLVTRNLSLEEKVCQPEFARYQCLLDWREKYKLMSLDSRYRSLKNTSEVQMDDGVALVGEISCLTYEARRVLYQVWLDCEDALGQELMDPESRLAVEAELAKDIELTSAFGKRLVLRKKLGGMYQQKWAL